MDSTQRRIGRRRLLRRAAAAGWTAVAAPYIVPASVFGRGGAIPPGERITVGVIGTGGQGRYDMGGFLASRDAQVVAVCDVKAEAREAARQQVDRHYGTSGCAAYRDFRELTAREDIDVVLIASPDHWHVLHALEAVRAGKDVYLEKPMAVSLQQALALRAEVRRRNRVFQFGTQQRSTPHFRFACELVRNGRIGPLREVQVSAPGGWDQRTGEPGYPVVPVPEGLDYDLWLGPAPMAPYTPKRVVTPYWFHISDYAVGYVAGWGIHHVDIAQWGMGTEDTGPVEIEGSGVFPTDDGLCDTALNWDMKLTYANGVRMHFVSDGQMHPHGIRFVGRDGWIYVNRERLETHPRSLLCERIGRDEIHLPLSTQHQQNLLECVRTRRRTVCDIETAVRSETICHLCDIAMRLGRRLRWDPQAERFIDDEEANRRMARPMQAPWRL